MKDRLVTRPSLKSSMMMMDPVSSSLRFYARIGHLSI